jgi:hypothetical protein
MLEVNSPLAHLIPQPLIPAFGVGANRIGGAGSLTAHNSTETTSERGLGSLLRALATWRAALSCLGRETENGIFRREMARPTRFERVIFAFGGQTSKLAIAEQRLRQLQESGVPSPRFELVRQHSKP